MPHKPVRPLGMRRSNESIPFVKPELEQSTRLIQNRKLVYAVTHCQPSIDCVPPIRLGPLVSSYDSTSSIRAGPPIPSTASELGRSTRRVGTSNPSQSSRNGSARKSPIVRTTQGAKLRPTRPAVECSTRSRDFFLLEQKWDLRPSLPPPRMPKYSIFRPAPFRGRDVAAETAARAQAVRHDFPWTPARGLRAPTQRWEAQRLAAENLKLLHSIMSVQGYYSRAKWAKDDAQAQEFKRRLSRHQPRPASAASRCTSKTSDIEAVYGLDKATP